MKGLRYSGTELLSVKAPCSLTPFPQSWVDFYTPLLPKSLETELK